MDVLAHEAEKIDSLETRTIRIKVVMFTYILKVKHN